MKVYCLFYCESSYECSCETLMGVYEAESDAETALLEEVAKAEAVKAQNNKVHIEADKFWALKPRMEEAEWREKWQAMRQENPIAYSDFSGNIHDYVIRKVVLGERL